MGEIQVTSGTIRSKAGELRSLNARLKSAVGELKSTEATLRGEYVGEASDAFHTSFTKNSAKWDAFSAAIEQYVNALETIAASYEAAEATAVSMVH